MKLTLLADDRVRYELTTSAMTVDAPTADTQFSPYHMLAGGLAACTHSTIASWAERAKLSVADLAVEVSWTFAEEPHRVGAMTVELEWPSLPPARREAARRAADLCPVHHTLQTPVAMTTVLRETATPATAPMPAAHEAA